jgi:hypothetical protein
LRCSGDDGLIEQQTHERRRKEISAGLGSGGAEFGQRIIESSLDWFQIISALLHMKEINDANHDFLICSHR